MTTQYIITSFGLDGGPVYANKAIARRALSALKSEDKKRCRAKFGGPLKVTSSRDSYKIEFGCNLWSARSIHPY